MRIAVVDDERNWLVKIKRYVKEYFGEMDVEIRAFFSGEAFLEDAGEYQIVFMDIEMPGRDGFSVLQEYRMEHEDSLFIILTTHIEMSREGYKVEAFRYIDKHKMMDEIREALDSALLNLQKYQMVSIPVCFLGEQRLQCYDILYFEVYDHVVLMHTRDGETYHCTEPLKSLVKKLKDKGFVLTSRSYLVNLEHIRKVEQDKVCLSGSQTLLLSRGKYASIRKQHFEWKMRRANG